MSISNSDRVTPGRTPPGERWTGRGAFILAAIGSAVGLGSIWKFPYEVGSNGGAVFVLFYLAGLLFIVFPLMLVEFAIGRRGGADAAASIAAVAVANGRSRGWGTIGILGAFTSWLVLTFYAVIGGWTLAYIASTSVKGLPGGDAIATQQHFDALLASPIELVTFQLLFLVMTSAVVARGVRQGIEAASNVLMPVLVALMIVLCAFAIVHGDAIAAVRFMFKLDITKLSMGTALEALGLGFFSIGVGMATLITYSAYADAKINLTNAAIVTIVADTSISFLAGFVVFPIVFGSGLNPAGGPGLVFVTLPLAFETMPFGRLAAAAFFVLLFIAALASAIAMLEICVEVVMRRLGWSRLKSSAVLAGGCFLAGLGNVFSFNHWAHWYPLSAIPQFATSTFFDLCDYATSNLLLPVAGISLAIFAGWIVSADKWADELWLSGRAVTSLRWLLRYFVPVCIAAATVVPWLRS